MIDSDCQFDKWECQNLKENAEKKKREICREMIVFF